MSHLERSGAEGGYQKINSNEKTPNAVLCLYWDIRRELLNIIGYIHFSRKS